MIMQKFGDLVELYPREESQRPDRDLAGDEVDGGWGFPERGGRRRRGRGRPEGGEAGGGAAPPVGARAAALEIGAGAGRLRGRPGGRAGGGGVRARAGPRRAPRSAVTEGGAGHAAASDWARGRLDMSGGCTDMSGCGRRTKARVSGVWTAILTGEG